MKCILCKKEIKNILTIDVRYGMARVFYCSTCDFAMLEDDRTQEELAEYYNNEYREKHTPNQGKATSPREIFETHVGLQQSRMDLMKPILKPNTSLLEIGCSAGQFLANLKDNYMRTVGIEYDKACAYHADTVSFATILNNEDMLVEEDMFDVVCMFQVLEHIKDPYKYLEDITKHLHNDGHVVIEVPNLHDVLVSTYDLPNHRKFFFHKAHLWYFTEESLNKLMESLGFEGKVHYTQDYNVFNHINWLIHDKGQINSKDGLNSPSVPFKKDIDSDIRDGLKGFMEYTNMIYKEVLQTLKVSSNIVYIGKRKK